MSRSSTVSSARHIHPDHTQTARSCWRLPWIDLASAKGALPSLPASIPLPTCSNTTGEAGCADAETMAFVTLSLCELFRAYTVRSEYASIFQIGVFSNRNMQIAVCFSIALLLLVCTVPFLQTVFNTHFLAVREWGVVLGLALIPAISEEITKVFLRMAHKQA